MSDDSTHGRAMGTDPDAFSGGAHSGWSSRRKPIPTRRVLEAVLWILNTGAQCSPFVPLSVWVRLVPSIDVGSFWTARETIGTTDLRQIVGAKTTLREVLNQIANFFECLHRDR